MSLGLKRSSSLLLCVLLCACPDDECTDDGAASSTSTGDPTTGGPNGTSSVPATGPGMTGNGVTTDDDTTGAVESSTGDASTGSMESSGDDTTTGDSATGDSSTGGSSSDSTGEMVDPYGPCGDCPEDSIEVEITGIPGCFCSPACGPDIDCPEPAEGTAVGMCVLESEPGDVNRCALLCELDDDCPTGAGCEFAGGNASICTHPVE